jgi:hypothetical protein
MQYALVALSLAFMLFRVVSPARVRVEGSVLQTISLSYPERVALQRLNLFVLGVLLVLAAFGRWFGLYVELGVIVIANVILFIPVHYRLTTSGVAVNQVVFRHWNEFARVDVSAGKVTLVGRPGNGKLNLWVRAAHQHDLLRVVRQRVRSAASGSSPANQARMPRIARN